jgi:uncharacterized protein (DUF362 family)
VSTVATVNVVRCAVQASDAQVKEAVARALDGLGPAPDDLIQARRILVKPNAAGMDQRAFGGRFISVVDPSVLAGVVAWIRERSMAEIVIAEGQHYVPMEERYREVGYEAALAAYDVRFIAANGSPFASFQVPGGGLMFSSYELNAELAGIDVTVSVAKMKAHLATGATGTLKNLFGLAPNDVYGGPLRYLHAPVRLPRVLVDLGLLFPPCLSIIDGVVAAEGREWNGRPVTPEVILAGTNTVATDATTMHLMGLDPQGDYPEHPYTFDRNPLQLAAEAGLGPNDLSQVDVRSERQLDDLVIPFQVDLRRDAERIDRVRRSTAEQAILYASMRREFLERYEGQYVVLVDGEVLCSLASLHDFPSRTELAEHIGRPDAGLYLKKVVPEAEEREHLQVYAEILDAGPAT